MSGPPSLHMSHEGEHRHPRHDPGAHSMRVAAARRLGQLLGRDRSSQRAARRVDAPPRVQLGRAAHPRCRRCGGRRCRDRASRSVLLSVIGGAMLEFVFGHSRCRCGGLGDGGGVRGLLDLRLHRRRRVPFQARRGGAHERRPTRRGACGARPTRCSGGRSPHAADPASSLAFLSARVRASCVPGHALHRISAPGVKHALAVRPKISRAPPLDERRRSPPGRF